MGAARRRVTILAIGGLALAAPPAGADGLSARAADQIAALQKVKTSLTAPERKLDSRLALALRQRAGRGLPAAISKLKPGVTVTRSGLTEVDVRVTAVTGDLLARLEAAGATVRHASKAVDELRAGVPVAALARIAAWPDVRRVDVALEPLTARMRADGAAKQRLAARSPTTEKSALAAPLRAEPATEAQADQGTVVSQGDVTHAVDRVREERGLTGFGTKICALSDGVWSLAEEQRAGELPAVDVLPGQEGGFREDEGTAMLEIIHDLAPRAALGFATAFSGPAQFADNIRALRAELRCDVIVDDVFYGDEAPFQDGPIAQAVNDVTADGALYFSVAGNHGNTLDGTAANYEADFRSSGRRVGRMVGTAHDFDPGPAVQVFEPLSDPSSWFVLGTLWWADPLGASANDYDLYVFDADDRLVSFSQNVQNGDDDPFEMLETPMNSIPGLRMAVVKVSGADRYFQLSGITGRFRDSAGVLPAWVTPGMTRGHAAAVDAFGVAAAPAAGPLPFDLEPGDPPNPRGPFPGVFAPTQRPERFTSDGPRRVFFDADGSPITPGNFSSTGGTVRQKPDLTAADGVRTGVNGFESFFGTSAAAPHAAAIAALVFEGNPSVTTADLRSAFAATDLDVAPPGVDGRSGTGIVRADRLLDFTGAIPPALIEAGAPTVTPQTGDGDAYLEPGERATVSLPLTNRGDGPGEASVTARVDDPRATLAPRVQSYGTLAAGSTTSRTFTLTLSSSYPRGRPLALDARVEFLGRHSPTTARFRVRTGKPAATATTFSYAGPPVAIPDADPEGASVPIEVTGMGYADALTLSIDGRTCGTDEHATTVGLDHTFVGDLIGTLTAPDGSHATLFSRTGGDGNNMCRAVFDDAAARPFAAATADDAPYTGSWRPDQPLAGLLFGAVDGTWTFHVVDAAGVDEGSIRAVSLHLKGLE